MSNQTPEAAEQEFFTALVEADVAALGRVLSDDFLLIDVMTGSEVSRAALLEVVGSGQLRFDGVDRTEYRVRLYGATAVITGRTEMRGGFGDQTFRTESRYTHVFVGDGDR